MTHREKIATIGWLRTKLMSKFLGSGVTFNGIRIPIEQLIEWVENHRSEE